MKNNINFNNKYNYGVEIEFANKNYNLIDLYNLSEDKLKYSFYHKEDDVDYKEWIIDVDPSVSTEKRDGIYGGEISSKILSDNKKDWQELKEICTLLKKYKSYINNSCSSHITVDISKYLNDNKFFETLYKLLIIFEDNIKLFYMGDEYLIRKDYYLQYRNVGYELLNNIDKVDFNCHDFINDILYNTNSLTKGCGVNLDKIKDGLIEIRYPNGTLNPDTIQNNINFTLSLIDAISKENIDLDFLNHIISKLNRNDPFYKYDVIPYFTNNSIFNYLIDNISPNNESKENFNKQYQKVLKTKQEKQL